MIDPLPKPSKLVMAVSGVVIAGSLVVLSSVIAANVAELNPFAIISGLIVFLPCVFVAALQYRGTFGCVWSAAMGTSVILYVIGGIFAFALVTYTGEAILEDTSLLLMAPFLIFLFVAAALSIVFGRVNALWSKKLRVAIAAGAMPSVPCGLSSRELLHGLAFFGVMAGVAWLFVWWTPPRKAEGVAVSAAPFGLPVGATDVSYCQGSRGAIAYEFTIDESGFRDWVDLGIGSIESESAGIPLREISAPVTMRRYYAYSEELDGPDEISINKGLYYNWSKEDRGVYAAFDRTSSRAYYYAHSN